MSINIEIYQNRKDLSKRTEAEWLRIISNYTHKDPQLWAQVIAIVWWDFGAQLEGGSPEMKKILPLAYHVKQDLPHEYLKRALLNIGYCESFAEQRSKPRERNKITGRKPTGRPRKTVIKESEV